MENKLTKVLGFDLVIIALFLLTNCDSVKSKPILNEEPESIPLIKNSSQVDILMDTISFKKIGDLIKYFEKKIDSLEKLKIAAYKIKKSGDEIFPSSIQQLETEYYGTQDQRNDAIYNFLITHDHNSENLTGIKYLVLDLKIPVAKIDTLFRQFPANLQNSPEGKLWGTKIEERKKTENMALYNLNILNEKLTDLNGKSITLKQIDAKLILLDFWASWCGPCRYQNRALVAEMKEFRNDVNLAIVAVSLDTDREKWINASKEDGLTYMTVCDFKALDSPISKEFKLSTVPYNILIDKNGRILGTNLWGNKLMSTLTTFR